MLHSISRSHSFSVSSTVHVSLSSCSPPVTYSRNTHNMRIHMYMYCTTIQSGYVALEQNNSRNAAFLFFIHEYIFQHLLANHLKGWFLCTGVRWFSFCIYPSRSIVTPTIFRFTRSLGFHHKVREHR